MFSLKMAKPLSVCSFFKYSLVISTAFTLCSCDLAANYTKTDRAANMEFQDFRDGLSERLPAVEEENEKEQASTASIPELQPYLSMTPDSMKSMPLVSVSSDGTVSLRDLLYELARQAEYDLELDPNIRGAVLFTARNKPFDLVVERLANVAGLRYKFEDDFLRVELDTPYNKTYKIDYLSFIRSNQGSVSTSVSVVTGEGADTGSSYSASSDSTSDFWGELELNLTQMLDGVSTGGLKTSYDPRVEATERNPEVAAVSPQPVEGQSADGSPEVQVQPPQAVLNVQSLPVDDAESGNDDEERLASFSLNKQAGLATVYATEKAHKEVHDYLNELRKSVTAQVLVEAKIFEVSLFDEYVNGIEWQALAGEGIAGFVDAASDNVIGGFTVPGGQVATTSNFGIGWFGSDVDAFVEMIAGFGTVRALASPRLTVINNQSAVLNVATNRVYFEIDLDRETDDDTGDVTLEIDTDIKSVPEGVLINVQPSVDLDSRTISMFVRPTITRIVGQVEDPSVLFVAGDTGITSEIPEVNVQEIDTVVRVNSGQPIVMGGLLQDRVTDTQEGIPVLSEVPIIGSAFKTQEDLISKTELVIFLKATLLENAGDTIHDTDRDLYRTFSGDRRPFKL